LADISVLNGALLVEHNVALYLERCSGSVGSIDMDHCICNAPQWSSCGERRSPFVLGAPSLHDRCGWTRGRGACSVGSQENY